VGATPNPGEVSSGPLTLGWAYKGSSTRIRMLGIARRLQWLGTAARRSIDAHLVACGSWPEASPCQRPGLQAWGQVGMCVSGGPQ